MFSDARLIALINFFFRYVRSTRDVVVDRETGYLVPYGDCEAVADKTNELLGDHQRYQTLSHNARRRVMQFFSLERVVDGHERILTANIDRGGKS